MSWDVCVSAMKETEVYERNVTWNNGAIFVKALGCEFRELDGKSCREVVMLLNRAIADIAQNRSAYAELEPENGWGGIDDSLDLLRGLRQSCEEYPDGHIHIS